MRGREESTLATDDEVARFTDEIRAASESAAPRWAEDMAARGSSIDAAASPGDLWFAQLIRNMVTTWPELAEGLDFALMRLLASRDAMRDTHNT